jgi:transposase
MRIRLRVSTPGEPAYFRGWEISMSYVGWDWASRSHDVTVLDDGGAVLDRWAFSHTEAGWQMALGRLRSHGEPGDLPVIIEKTSGLIVERILAAGYPVVPVHPNSLYAARPRWGASGAKSDPGDSYKLADYLRTDGHRLRRMEPTDAGLRELQALVRLREDQVRARTAALNQLWAMLGNYWPGPRNLFHSLASEIALAFLTAYPTPQAAAHLGEARMAAFLRRHSYRGGKSPALLLARLRAEPQAPLALPPATLAAMVSAHVQQLRTLQAAIASIERLIASRVAAHPRARLLRDLPGVGTINLAQLLAEVGPILDRTASADRPPPNAAPPRSPARPGRRPVSTSAGPRAPEPAKPSPRSLTTPGCNHRGPPGSTPTPAPAASATPTPPASSPAPGSASSGPAGTQASPTTPTPTAPSNATPREDLT